MIIRLLYLLSYYFVEDYIYMIMIQKSENGITLCTRSSYIVFGHVLYHAQSSQKCN